MCLCVLKSAAIITNQHSTSRINIGKYTPLELKSVSRFCCLAHIMPLIYWSLSILPENSHPESFLRKGVLKIYSKFTGEHPCRSVISIRLLRNVIEITLRHGCSPVNLLHIFRTPFTKNTSVWLLLYTPWKHQKNELIKFVLSLF